MSKRGMEQSLLEDDAYQSKASASAAASSSKFISTGSTEIKRIANSNEFLAMIQSTQDQESILAGCLAFLTAPALFLCYPCSPFNIVIKTDEIGLVVRNGAPILLEPGRHFLPSPITHFIRTEKIDQDVIRFESITILNLRANQIAYVLDNGEYLEIKEPGRYFWNSSLCQLLGTYNLNEKVISAGVNGPLRRLIVNPGEVAVIFEQGHLRTLEKGIYDITDPTAQYSAHMPIAQEMHKLEKITTMSADGLNLTATAAVFFSISNPEILITAVAGKRKYNDIVDERARIALAEAIRGCHIRDIGTKPRASEASTSTMLANMSTRLDSTSQTVDYSRISRQIHDTFFTQLREEMTTIGIHIDLVQLEELKPEEALHKLLAQQATASAAAQAAITQAQAAAETTRLTATAAAERTQIEARAQADASKVLAEAEARNQETKAQGEANAIKTLAEANASRITQEGEATAGAITAQAEALGDPRLAAAVRMVDASSAGMGNARSTIVSPGTFFAFPGMANDFVNAQAPAVQRT